MMKKILYLFFLIFTSAVVFSQDMEDFGKVEDSLKILGKLVLNGETDFIKYNANEKFMTMLDGALLKDKSFDYPFDSLTMIARLKSDDNKFRLFNWNLKKADGTYEFFGFLFAWNDKYKNYFLYTLNDKSDIIKTPEIQALDPHNWYGAHYYKIIQNKSGKKKYYTLLGWHGFNTLIQKKIIDVLYFNANDKPIFGASIFKYNKKTCKRIIFEYSALTSMSLKYDKQYLQKGKKKRPMIVFDDLQPQSPSLTGNFQYYYPETNVVDAFLYKKGKWYYQKDIDARNPKETKEEKKHRQQIIKEQNDNLRK
jgi:hypothetical protein